MPDEDPDLEPTGRLQSHDGRVVPYEIMRWFMEYVTEEVDHCRAEPARGGAESAE
ncbi:hypothetical protein [Kitasatospora sp. NPDC001527]|uniref:hypothetical protein n=1 Tax=Kitasatospora sp. NPDC001527 TaxID=3154519 RepID=UPI0033180D5D